LKRSCLPGMDGIQPFPRWSGGHHPLFIIFIFSFIFILPSPSCLKSYQLVACVIRSNHPTYRMFCKSTFGYQISIHVSLTAYIPEYGFSILGSVWFRRFKSTGLG
jgi:hypothetical protein